jgi:hypothetical protein
LHRHCKAILNKAHEVYFEVTSGISLGKNRQCPIAAGHGACISFPFI